MGCRVVAIPGGAIGIEVADEQPRSAFAGHPFHAVTHLDMGFG